MMVCWSWVVILISMQSWKQDLLFKNRLTGKLCQVFLFYVPNLVGISIDYLANLENVIANHLGNYFGSLPRRSNFLDPFPLLMADDFTCQVRASWWERVNQWQCTEFPRGTEVPKFLGDFQWTFSNLQDNQWKFQPN